MQYTSDEKVLPIHFSHFSNQKHNKIYVIVIDSTTACFIY